MGYKAYGCIVVDTETKTIKSVHIPVCKFFFLFFPLHLIHIKAMYNEY